METFWYAGKHAQTHTIPTLQTETLKQQELWTWLDTNK